jgi:putative hemolysin
MDTVWVEIVLIAVSILVNGFFSGSEIALVSARPSRLHELAAQGATRARRALELKRNPDDFLATIQIAITLVGTLASAVGGATAVAALTPWLQSLAVPGAAQWAQPVALGLVIVVMTFFSLVIGELTPKALALRNPERLACLVAGPIHWATRAVSILGRVLTWSTRVVLFLLGQRDAPVAPPVSEEEIKYLVREGAAHGVFEPRERELVDRVFRFTDTPVRAIMVPRASILGLDVATPPDQILLKAAELGRTRFPVFRGSVNEPVGVVVIKDLLRMAALGVTPALESLAHPPFFVPESARVAELLQQFQRHHVSLALVVDEYGQVVGLVTVEDLVEEIVGEIREEGESPDLASVARLPDGSYIIGGTTTVRDLRERLGLPVDESPSYQTVAGFLLHRIGSLPQPGVRYSLSGYRWTALKMDGPRIVEVRAEPEKT